MNKKNIVKLERRTGLSLWLRYPKTALKATMIFNRTMPFHFALWFAAKYTYQVFKLGSKVGKKGTVEWEYLDDES